MLEAEIREQLRGKQRQAARETNRKRRGDGDGTVFVNNSEHRPDPPRDARKEAADLLNVASAYVSDAERIREASPETFAEVKAAPHNRNTGPES